MKWPCPGEAADQRDFRERQCAPAPAAPSHAERAIFDHSGPALRRSRRDPYAFPTPNSSKVAVLLEELGVPHASDTMNVRAGEQKTAEHVARNPKAKVPVIVDRDGPGGAPLTVVESAAILVYLAEKHGRFIPTDAVARVRCFEWLLFQAAGLGPTFGQA